MKITPNLFTNGLIQSHFSNDGGFQCCFYHQARANLVQMAGLASLLCIIEVFLVGTDSGVGIASPVGCPKVVGGIAAILAGPFCFAIW